MRNKSRSTAIFLGFVLITLVSTEQSSGILGLSKCEKMVKSVQSQDRLNSALWANYDRERKKLISSPKKGEELSYLLDRPASEVARQTQINRNLIGMALDINKSGLKSLNLMKAQPSCFKVDTYAKLINQATMAEGFVREWQSAYRSKASTQYSFKTIFPTNPLSYLKIFPVK
jgi:hypothetical protein